MRVDEPVEQIQPGQAVAWGRYVLLEVLGRGGLATVFRARDTRDGSEVALKVLCDRYVGRPEREERLRREFEYAARVDHPAIVKVFEQGQLEDGRPFFSMELIEGPPLSRIISGSGGLPFERTRRLARAIAAALEALHRAEIVHRDVKPENVLVLEDDRIKLIDFGMAGDGDAPTVPAGHTSRLTRANDLLGTHEYMAPEQVLKAPPRRAMDVFALGVVMYEMMSSLTPYSGMGMREYVELQIAGDPLLRSAARWARVTGAPEAFAELVDDCRRRDPKQRPRDMREVIGRLEAMGELVASSSRIVPMSVPVSEAIERARTGTHAGVGASPWKRPAVGVATLVAAAAVVLLWGWPSSNDREASRPMVISLVQGAESDGPTAVAGAPTVPLAGRALPAPTEDPAPTVAAPPRGIEDVAYVAPGGSGHPASQASEDTAPRARSRKSRPRPERPRVEPSPSADECAHVVSAARAAFKAYRWSAVLRRTKGSSCWAEHRAEYLMMRTEALMEEARWAECVRTGQRSTDPSVKRHAERCQKRLDTIAKTP